VNPLRSAILAAAGNDTIRRLVPAAPPTRAVVRRFVAGAGHVDAGRTAGELVPGGRSVTLDMEDHGSVDATLRVLARLRRRYPGTGAVLQAYPRRTLDDCAALAGAGSRVRLCKGAYAAPDAVAFGDRHAVDVDYVRCAAVLPAGAGHPMLATHDPRLIALPRDRTQAYNRKPGSYEYQLLYGVRPDEQRRLAGAGETVRVYVPYGEQWYGYLMRRLAERPANPGFFLRALRGTG
jgi:proline dehydrogenase